MGKQKYAICPICERELPLNRENFKRIKDKSTGKEKYNSICKNVSNNRKKKNRIKNRKTENYYAIFAENIYENTLEDLIKYGKFNRTSSDFKYELIKTLIKIDLKQKI